jgi:hypothetical protein
MQAVGFHTPVVVVVVVVIVTWRVSAIWPRHATPRHRRPA